MPPPPAAVAAMDSSMFGYMDDLQELTIIERPVRRSLKVRRRGPPGTSQESGGCSGRVVFP